MVNFIKVKKSCLWRMILLSGIRSEGLSSLKKGGIIGRQEYPITTVFQMGSSCFSALLSCSLKFPRAYITQQCTRRVFYFFIIIHPLIFAWYYWLFCISWCIYKVITPTYVNVCPSIISVEKRKIQQKKYWCKKSPFHLPATWRSLWLIFRIDVCIA